MTNDQARMTKGRVAGPPRDTQFTKTTYIQLELFYRTTLDYHPGHAYDSALVGNSQKTSVGWSQGGQLATREAGNTQA
jgi:hypothetical protein